MRAHGPHSSRCRSTSSSRWRRRSPLDKARSAGRHRSVGGSTPSAARRYSTRRLARARLSRAATAPGVEPRPAAIVRVSSPFTSCATRTSRSPAESCASAMPMSVRSSCRSTSVAGDSTSTWSTRRCERLRARSFLSAYDATRLRAVRDAYCGSLSGATRDRADITLARVSCTRSSTLCGSLMRAPTTRRSMGTRSIRASSSANSRPGTASVATRVPLLPATARGPPYPETDLATRSVRSPHDSAAGGSFSVATTVTDLLLPMTVEGRPHDAGWVSCLPDPAAVGAGPTGHSDRVASRHASDA